MKEICCRLWGRNTSGGSEKWNRIEKDGLCRDPQWVSGLLAKDWFNYRGICEGVVQWESWRKLRCEKRAYYELRALQGNNIPHLMAEVSVWPDPASNATNVKALGLGERDYNLEMHHIGGLLFDFEPWRPLACPDLSLWRLRQFGTTLQNLAQCCIDTINVFHDAGVLSVDLAPEHFIIAHQRKYDDEGLNEVWIGNLALFLFDFSSCRFTADAQQGQKPHKVQWKRDNQRIIGDAMLLLAETHGVILNLRYVPAEEPAQGQ